MVRGRHSSARSRALRAPSSTSMPSETSTRAGAWARPWTMVHAHHTTAAVLFCCAAAKDGATRTGLLSSGPGKAPDASPQAWICCGRANRLPACGADRRGPHLEALLAQLQARPAAGLLKAATARQTWRPTPPVAGGDSAVRCPGARARTGCQVAVPRRPLRSTPHQYACTPAGDVLLAGCGDGIPMCRVVHSHLQSWRSDPIGWH